VTQAWREQAFEAYARGDNAAAARALEEGGTAVLGDSAALQLLAISQGQTCDELALLQLAALEAGTGDANAWFNLGVVEQRLGMNEKALQRYQQALRLDPVHGGALNNASDLLRRQGRAGEAWALLQRYVAAGADTRGLEIRFAKVADDCGLPDEARAWFALATGLEPARADLRWEQAMHELGEEAFAQGWRGYEARRAIYAHAVLGLVGYPVPEWHGGALAGRSLLVHKEQGLGDTIMFASCLSDLPDGGGSLHLAVQPPLVRLFAHNYPAASVWASSSAAGMEDVSGQRWWGLAGQIDCHVPFGSLCRHLRADGFPAARPYLGAAALDRARWRERLAVLCARDDADLRAGIVLTARRDGEAQVSGVDGAAKSMCLRAAQTLDVPGIRWVGLHDRATGNDLARVPRLDIIDSSDWLQDMADTAALIAELDLVVAVDTAVAHLAGAMGKKVLLMLRHKADWRWGRTRADSYWYSDVEVFRQAREGDWWQLGETVAGRLRDLVEASRAAPGPFVPACEAADAHG
jgi:hypothetical protein